jgi:hypothetical protein
MSGVGTDGSGWPGTLGGSGGGMPGSGGRGVGGDPGGWGTDMPFGFPPAVPGKHAAMITASREPAAAAAWEADLRARR